MCLSSSYLRSGFTGVEVLNTDASACIRFIISNSGLEANIYFLGGGETVILSKLDGIKCNQSTMSFIFFRRLQILGRFIKELERSAQKTAGGCKFWDD